jgi:hypothetical protein
MTALSLRMQQLGSVENVVAQATDSADSPPVRVGPAWATLAARPVRVASVSDLVPCNKEPLAAAAVPWFTLSCVAAYRGCCSDSSSQENAVYVAWRSDVGCPVGRASSPRARVGGRRSVLDLSAGALRRPMPVIPECAGGSLAGKLSLTVLSSW